MHNGNFIVVVREKSGGGEGESGKESPHPPRYTCKSEGRGETRK